MISVKPKQSLGQNFLIDENIARNIVRELNPKKDDIVLEIGAGHGALTRWLAGRVQHLIIIEIDGRIVNRLRTEFSSTGTTIVHSDFLEVNIERWKKKFGKRVRFVGNIPYHLTSPILFKIFEEHASVQDLTVLTQREVGQRIVAHPGSKEYGILSVMTQFYGRPRLLFDVSANCFFPKPKVTSTVLHITLREKLSDNIDEELFRSVVRTAFGKRRKTLRNSLRYLPLEESIVDQVVESDVVPMEKRPEQLSVEQFVSLTEFTEKILV